MFETDYAVAPGEWLHEWMELSDVSALHVAKLLQMSPDQADELLDGRLPVTDELAARLARVTDIPAASWLRFEAAYRADLTRLATRQQDQRPSPEATERPRTPHT